MVHFTPAKYEKVNVRQKEPSQTQREQDLISVVFRSYVTQRTAESQDFTSSNSTVSISCFSQTVPKRHQLRSRQQRLHHHFPTCPASQHKAYSCALKLPDALRVGNSANQACWLHAHVSKEQLMGVKQEEKQTYTRRRTLWYSPTGSATKHKPLREYWSKVKMKLKSRSTRAKTMKC